MILKLIGGLNKHKEFAVAFLLCAFILNTAFDRITALFPKPSQYHEMLEARAMRAEVTAKAYTQEQAINTDRLIEAKHQDVLRAISAVNNNVENLRTGSRASFESLRQEIREDRRNRGMHVNFAVKQ